MWYHLLWTVIVSYFVGSQSRLSSPNDRADNEKFFTDILDKVLQTSRPNDVLLIFRDSLLSGEANDILGKIVATITRNVSTLYVNADQTEPEFQVSSWAMSRDLVVYIYVSERGPDIAECEVVAEDTKRFIHNRVRPKVLILMMLHQPCHDLVTLFRAIWSRKILDAIVVEYSKSEYLKHPTIVHRYNPFIDSYTKEPYSPDVTWFTDEFPNMHGYPLVYAVTTRHPYSNIVSTFKGQELKGMDKLMNEMLADKMNFTGIQKIVDAIFLRSLSNGSTYGIMVDLASGKYDALLVTLPIWEESISNRFNVQYTDSLVLENWCFAIPRLPAKQTFIVGTVIQIFFMNFSIIGILWLCSKLMKFNPNRWYTVRIIGIILGTSFPPSPTKLHERIVLLSILIVYISYSSTIFAELTSTGLENRYIHFDHLEDLMKSDLMLMMFDNLWYMVKQYNHDFEYYTRKLGKEILSIPSTQSCVEDLFMHQNTSCFMNEDWAKLVALNNMRNGKIMIEITKLCYLSLPIGNVFPKGSPYIKRVSEIISMLTEGGISDKWYHEYLRNETKIVQINQDQANSMYVNVFYPIIYKHKHLISKATQYLMIFSWELFPYDKLYVLIEQEIAGHLHRRDSSVTTKMQA
ncbi:uncharacterized protein LOC105427690 [Pogonomyrmex barbatus]|uniref:Uncharacterized protein LOC105427690 n=1 Tax=Pogonomyrmex barbatus TaxID=144034 RepID=A0A6I9W7V8_9HYME|nr:uncharacterized protein LOC105427690 [Pogonomyrmex barbatus]